MPTTEFTVKIPIPLMISLPTLKLKAFHTDGSVVDVVTKFMALIQQVGPSSLMERLKAHHQMLLHTRRHVNLMMDVLVKESAQNKILLNSFNELIQILYRI
jgi:hypothetical protein